MVGTTVTRCAVAGCTFKTLSDQPGMALAQHLRQSHSGASPGSMQMQQAQGLREKLRVVTVERNALRDHLERFHICSDLCTGERP